MKSGLLLAVILPVAFAVKKDQQSCNSSCVKVLQKQQESCPSGSDADCLCKLSDSDYWEPLADCDCINPDKNFQHQKLRFKYVGLHHHRQHQPHQQKQLHQQKQKLPKQKPLNNQAAVPAVILSHLKLLFLKPPLYKSSMLNQLLVLLPP